MRRLKVPGRIIGRLAPSPHHRYFIPDSGSNKLGYSYRFRDDTDLPISNTDFDGNLIDPLVLSANAIRTFWNSPWRDDPQLTTRHNLNEGDVDQDGRDRMGMPVKPLELDESYIRILIVKYLLNYAVGVLVNGSIFPQGRCWCWRTQLSPN